MSDLITADDLEWRSGNFGEQRTEINNYRIVRFPDEVYTVYRLEHNFQPLTSVGILYNLNDVLTILNK